MPARIGDLQTIIKKEIGYLIVNFTRIVLSLAVEFLNHIEGMVKNNPESFSDTLSRQRHYGPYSYHQSEFEKVKDQYDGNRKEAEKLMTFTYEKIKHELNIIEYY